MVINSFENWEAAYKPVRNPLNPDGAHNGYMFETYGEEFEKARNTSIENIWTLVEDDGMEAILSGFHLVNRIGYFITEVPWTEETAVNIPTTND
jgi:hypothetical protein